MQGAVAQTLHRAFDHVPERADVSEHKAQDIDLTPSSQSHDRGSGKGKGIEGGRQDQAASSDSSATDDGTGFDSIERESVTPARSFGQSFEKHRPSADAMRSNCGVDLSCAPIKSAQPRKNMAEVMNSINQKRDGPEIKNPGMPFITPDKAMESIYSPSNDLNDRGGESSTDVVTSIRSVMKYGSQITRAHTNTHTHTHTLMHTSRQQPHRDHIRLQTHAFACTRTCRRAYVCTTVTRATSHTRSGRGASR